MDNNNKRKSVSKDNNQDNKKQKLVLLCDEFELKFYNTPRLLSRVQNSVVDIYVASSFNTSNGFFNLGDLQHRQAKRLDNSAELQDLALQDYELLSHCINELLQNKDLALEIMKEKGFATKNATLNIDQKARKQISSNKNKRYRI